MSAYKNEFSWSKSRNETFCKCHRMYYFHYYGYWGAWFDEADEKTKKLWVLRRLKNRHLWAGTKVHECIKEILDNIHNDEVVLDKHEAVERTIEIMRKEFKDSKQGKYWRDRDSCALFEHEYELDLLDSEWKEIADKVRRCILNFYVSDEFSFISELTRGQWLVVEELLDFEYDKTKIFIRPDFIFRDGEEVHIFDWKTGKVEADSNRLQLGCYTLYAVQKWNVIPNQVISKEVYLSSREQIEYRHSAGEFDEIRLNISSSIDQMKDILDDQRRNLASENKFSFTDNEYLCKSCNFQIICPKWE